MNTQSKRYSLPRNSRSLRRVVRARRRLIVESLESRCLMTGGFQNPLNRFDVNSDGFVTPMDSLFVLNMINNAPPSIPTSAFGPPPTGATGPFPDVDGNDVVDARDVLAIGDFINGSSNNVPLAAQVRYQLYVNNEPVDSQQSPTLYVGDQLLVEVQIRDARTGGSGLFSTYMDTLVRNKSGSSIALLEYKATQWMNPFSNGKFASVPNNSESPDTYRMTVGGMTGMPVLAGNDWRAVHRIQFLAIASGDFELKQAVAPVGGAISAGVSLNGGAQSFLKSSELELPALTISIQPDGGPTLAVNDSERTFEDMNLTILPLSNDSGRGIKIVNFSQPQVGTVRFSPNDNSRLLFEPAPNFYGVEVFTYTISDSRVPSQSSTGTVTVTVESVNDAPTARDDAYTIDSLSVQSTLLDVMANDDPGPNEQSWDRIRLVSVSSSLAGATVQIADNKIRYTPSVGFTGLDSFEYSISDIAGMVSRGKVRLDVGPPLRPQAMRDALTLNRDSTNPISIDVLGNDFVNPGADPILLGVSAPSIGTAEIDDNGTPANLSDDKVRFAWPANYFGTVSFMYTMSDTAPDSIPSTAEVRIEVPIPRGFYQNPRNRFDVDDDGVVDRSDYDPIISALNRRGPVDELYGYPLPPMYLDVDGDDLLTPMDGAALATHLLKISSPLEPPAASMRYEFYALNPDGSLGRNLDPIPDDNIVEANILRGEKFIVRTLLKDNRTVPHGFYSTYTDLRYTNVDGSNAEKIEVQWSEYQTIGIGDAHAGSFRLAYGDRVTEPIAWEYRNSDASIHQAAVARNIEAAISNLPGFGPGSVSVRYEGTSNRFFPNLPHEFRISFKNGSARRDVPDPVVLDNRLTTGGVTPQPVEAYAFGFSTNYLTPWNLEAAIRRAPLDWPNEAFTDVAYGDFAAENQQSLNERTLSMVGGVAANRFLFDDRTSESNWIVSQDVVFAATQVGEIHFQSVLPPRTSDPLDIELGILMLGAPAEYLQQSDVSLAQGTLRVWDHVQAIDDQLLVDSTGELPLLRNDILPHGTSAEIVQVSPLDPPSAGEVFLYNGDVIFLWGIGYTGSATFTYTLRSSDGFTSTADVLLNVRKWPEIPWFGVTPTRIVPVNSGTFAYSFFYSDGIPDAISQSIQVTTSSNEILSDPVLDFLAGQSEGNVYFTTKPDMFGTTEVRLRIENGGVDRDLRTPEDNQFAVQTFQIIVAPPAKAFQNPVNALDVDSDGAITPSDLNIITKLLNDRNPSVPVLGLDKNKRLFWDVDGDDEVTVLDALAVMNHLNNAGTSPPSNPSVSMRFEYYALNPNGTLGRNLDPTPDDDESNARVFAGEPFVLRTLAKDERVNGLGLFSTYANLTYSNTDDQTAKKIVPQWNEVSLIQLNESVIRGSNTPGHDTFQLKFNGETTVPIALEFSQKGASMDHFQTARNIEYALGDLPSIGNGNVSVYPGNLLGFPEHDFAVFFQNRLANRDLPDLEIVQNKSSTGGDFPQLVSISIRNPNRNDPAKNLGSLAYLFEDQYLLSRYAHELPRNEQFPWTSTIEGIGGILFGSSPSTSTNWTPINEVLFDSVKAGVVLMTLDAAEPRTSQGLKLGVSMVGDSNDFIDIDDVNWPLGRIEIINGIDASPDEYNVVQSQSPHRLDVLSNDVNNRGGGWSIVSVTQPLNGFVSIRSDGVSIDYLTDPEFVGDVQFSYTVQNDHGDQAEATVTVRVADQNFPPTIDAIGDIESILDTETLTVHLTGIEPGYGDSYPVRVTARSSSIDVVSQTLVEYESPNSTGILRLTKGLIRGSSQITVTVEDPGQDGDFETANDNQTTSRSFTVTLGGFDFGDAPTKEQSRLENSYPVRLVDDGARHRLSLLALGGIAVDAELDGNPNANGLGDDASGRDDENGITFLVTNRTTEASDTRSTFIATATLGGFLDAWIDFNQDGDWLDAREQIAVRVPLEPGANFVSFTVPAGSRSGQTFGRFRISSVGGLLPTGPALDGEVEDYPITIAGEENPESVLRLGPSDDFRISVENGSIMAFVSNRLVWSAPATEQSKFRIIDASGIVLNELQRLGTAFPGSVSYDKNSGVIKLSLATPQLNLTEFVSSNLAGVNSIDMRGSTQSVLVLNGSDIQNINNSATLGIVMEAKDTIIAQNSPLARWVPRTGELGTDGWIQVFQYASTNARSSATPPTLRVLSQREWRNSIFPFDVDGDSFLSPLDVLSLVNAINRGVFEGTNGLPPRTSSDITEFYDPDGDNFLSPLDVLMLVNGINSGSNNAEGEHAIGESTPDVDIYTRASETTFALFGTHADDFDSYWDREDTRSTSTISGIQRRRAR